MWYSTTAVEESITDRVQVVFEAMGEQARVTDETFMDMATAVSGSGPAVSVYPHVNAYMCM